MVIAQIPWFILFTPLAAAIVIYLFLMRHPRLAAWTALSGIVFAFLCSLCLFRLGLSHKLEFPTVYSYSWIQMENLQINFGFLLDEFSTLMLLVVTGVSSCIFCFSIGYMKGDESYARYFAYLSLFVFSMIGIVLAHDFVLLFIFWELVAVTSYLLIGFWFQKPSAADAGNKAFLVNRVADFGLLVGILFIGALAAKSGVLTFSFSELATLLPTAFENGTISQGAITVAALLIFCGVAGKSAQFPLYIWLPDAMEGPTPVSALIHAATMVAAGIYLVCRTFFIVSLSPTALVLIASIGALTALLAALLAVVQNDIKKILAYSTISQLGYMALALGLGSSVVAMFHLSTHAFFKALLFLGAGSMIHALHTQDIWKMGKLLKPMPITAITFLIGSLALSGIWPLAGFFSKDAILILALEKAPILFWAGLFTAGLTAFYMTRLLWVAVIGPSKTKEHAHEAPLVMKLPLLILAFFAVTAGFMGISEFLSHGHAAHHEGLFVPILSSVVAIASIALGTLLYRNVSTLTQDPLQKLPKFFRETLIRKYYLDDFFFALANIFQKSVARLLFWFDTKALINGLVNGSATLAAQVGGVVRRAQTGRVHNYVIFFLFGVVFMVFFMMLKGSV